MNLVLAIIEFMNLNRLLMEAYVLAVLYC